MAMVLLFVMVFFLGFTGRGMAADNPVISSAAEVDYPPFSIIDEQGRANGFSIELMRAALAAMRHDVTFRTGPWSEVRKWLEQGKIQALPLVGRTPEREFLFDFTFPYMSLHGAIVVRKTTTGIQDLRDLKGLQVAVMKADNAEEFLRREDRGIDIRTTVTFEKALHNLSQGRYDAVFIQRLVALRLIRETGITNLKVLNKPIEGFRQDFCFAVKEGDRNTLALLNEGLALVIADGTYRHLHIKWFASMELPTHRKIIVGGDNNYPPYEYLDENGWPTGYNVDLTRAIAQAAGLEIEIRLGPWEQVRNALARGEIDVLQGMFYSPERDLTFDFTPPHTINHCVSVVRKKEGPAPASIEELAGKRIVVQQGDIMHDFALENGLKDQVSVTEAQEEALQELAGGKHDCALVARRIALYWIEKHGWKNLTVGKTPFLSPEYCFAVPNNQKALLAQFSEGLKILENTGEYRRIQEKWMGVYDDFPVDFTRIIRYAGLLIGSLIMVLIGFFLWSRSLRKQVNLKTRDLRKSEEKYRLIAENMANVISIMDMDLNFTYVSPSIIRLRDFTVEEVMQQTLDQIMTQKSLELISQAIEEELRLEAAGTADPGRSRIIELEEYKKDGSTIWVENTVSFIRDKKQAPVGILTISHDISERKQAEEQIARLGNVFEGSLNEIYLFDPDTLKFTHVNRAAQQNLGYTMKELQEMTPLALKPDFTAESFAEMIEPLRKGEKQKLVFKTVHKRKDQSLYNVEVHLQLLTHKQETLFVAIILDITEKIKLESQLNQAQKMESIGTLAGGIAHDFNNILFPIIGNTEMLIEDVPEDSPFRSRLEKIHKSSLRASDLVKQILTFSRQESGELKLMKMQPIIKEALKLIRSTIPTTIEIKQDIGQDCNAVKADPTQIHQIFMNLAANASYAMEEKGGHLNVRLRQVELGEPDLFSPEIKPGTYACLSISDTGRGMDKKLTQKIFDPFFTTKEKGKGTGMGLSVVHGIVASMKGDIRVDSEPGKGTEFHVYLPVAEAIKEKQPVIEKVSIQGGTEHILLVDDEKDIIEMEQNMLERLGYKVTARTSSLDALKAFETDPDTFDLVITDMAMPNMPGDKLSIELNKIRSGIPVILCTGFSETMNKEKAASIGIKGFLLKPIVIKDLAHKIREVVDKN